MAKKTVLQENYELGIRRNVARDSMPSGAVYDMWDLIPQRLGAPATKRGGWTSLYAPSSVTGYGLAYAPFSTGHRFAMLTSGFLRHSAVATPGTVTDVSAFSGNAVYQNPVFYRDLLLVPRDTNAIGSLNSALSFAAVSGSAPVARYLTIYKDRAVAGYVGSNQNRVQFGPNGLPTGTWDTTNAWVDTSAPVAGLMAMRSALLVYHEGSVERIRGSVPPGTAGFDMVLEPLFGDVGCIDARSIVGYQENVIWADVEGVFMTDGAALLNLTEAGGIKDLWRQYISGFVTNSWRCAAQVYSGLLIVSITNASGTHVATLVCDLGTRTWFRFQNFPFVGFAQSAAASDELYALSSTAQLASISSILAPASGNKNDGNSTAVLPGFETAYFAPRDAIANWRDAYLGYDLRDAASDNPTLTVTYKGINDAAFSNLGTLPETTRWAYKRITPRTTQGGVAFRVDQNAASLDTRFFQLVGDVMPLPDDRVF